MNHQTKNITKVPVIDWNGKLLGENTDILYNKGLAYWCYLSVIG